MVDIILMSSRIALFFTECVNHKYHCNIVENNVLFRLTLSNICNFYIDILKLINFLDIVYI